MHLSKFDINKHKFHNSTTTSWSGLYNTRRFMKITKCCKVIFSNQNFRIS